MKLTNHEILNIYLDNRIIVTCIECQFSKLKNNYVIQQFKDDFFNDLIVIILTYPNDKLNKIHKDNHFNAWLTRIIQNNLISTTSEFYKKYYKYIEHKEQLTKKYEEYEY